MQDKSHVGARCHAVLKGHDPRPAYGANRPAIGRDELQGAHLAAPMPDTSTHVSTKS